MSFPRASIKRFNESSGCAPPPGSYDPKINDKATGGVVDKSDRFKVYKDLSSTSLSAASLNNTPVKQHLGGAQNIKKPPKAPALVDNGVVKELEKEIRQLVKERNDKDKLLSFKEEELKKLDGRLHIVQLERTGLLAKLATAEKELKDTQKSIELLKSKLAASEMVYKKYEEIQIELSTLKQQLAHKDKEILKLKEDLNMAVKALGTCVDALDSLTNSLEENIATYRNMIQKLCEMPNDYHCERKTQRQEEDVNGKLHDDTVSVDEKLKICKKKSLEAQQRFHVAIKELNCLSKILQANYTKVNEDNLRLKQEMARLTEELKLVLSVKSSLEQHRDNLLDTNSNLQDQLKLVDIENKTAAEKLRTQSEKLDNLHVIKRNLELQLQDMETKHQELLNIATEQIGFLEESEISARQAAVNIHEKIVALQNENKELAEALGQTSELLCKAKDENDRLANFVQEIEGKREQEKKRFLIQIEELVFEKSKAESDLEDVQDKVMQMVNEFACQKSESDQMILDLNTHLECEKAEMEGLRNKLGDLIYEKSQLHMEIGHLEAELKLAKSESEERKEEAMKALECIRELKNSIEILNAEKCEAEKQALEMNYFNETLQSTLDKLQADFDEYSKYAEHDRSAAQSKIANLAEEVEGLKEQKDEMAQKFDDWLSEKYELEFEITKLQCRIQVIEMEADQSKQEVEKELQQCKDEKEQVTQEKTQMDKNMEQYGIELLSNAAQLQSLQCQLDRKVADLELLEAVNAELRQEINSKRDTVSQLEDNITVLKESFYRKCSEWECAVSEKCQVVKQLEVQRKESTDLDCTLQQLRADFVTTCNERDELFKKNEAKDIHLAVMSQEMTELTKHVKNLSVSLEEQSAQNVRLYDDSRKELVISSQKIHNYQQQIEEFKENLQEKCEECEELQQKYCDIDNELTLASKEIVDLHERVESLRREKEEEENMRSELMEKYEKNIEEVKEQIHGANSSPELEAELTKYRKLYEELLEKVGPFMEQIDAYELEKQMLLGLNKDTQEEMERLGRNYAQLLGHQNQKQKIKHIVKIKDENNALKRENVALKEQVTKQKIQLMKLDGSNTTQSSKIFQNTKENLNVTTSSVKSPLKTVNRK